MSLDVLQPVSDAAQAHAMLQPQRTIGNTIKIHTSHTGLPNLKNVSLALIGVLENRRNENELQQLTSVDSVRKQWYELYPGNWDSQVVDLGDIHAGDSVKDTYFALQQLTIHLLVKNILPIYIGGSQDLMYPIYRAFDELHHMVNLVNIDSRFDLGDVDASISSRSYVGKMVTDQPYNLYNYINLGYQTYFNSQDEIDLLERMYFDAMRLGELDKDITAAEPLLRDADMVSMDINVVQAGDIAFAKAYPNGLSGKQVCTLSRYAGLSDRTKVFGVFEMPLQPSITGAQLVAEVIWYFIEGYNFRVGEYPVNVEKDFIKYRVPINDEVLTFYKSNTTGRYWAELPFISNVNNKLKQHTLLPCTRQDYERACDQILPERWLKARKKIEV